ncbi:MAG: tRNA (adenosine(37)-N6)-threonylcarbamoyltransferase complex dimerization subunit type 1 TsaB [Lachnospiraceae bacterium]
MKILALDSSGLVASVAVVEDNQLLAEYTVNYKKTHSQTLLPMLDEIAKMIELDLETIDAIAVAAGPGSFTGLRIGSATAKGLGLALKKPLIPVPTVDALAYNLYDSTGVICPMMDARRKQVYTGIYRFADHELVTVSRQKAIAVEELIRELNALGEAVIFLGDGVTVYQEMLKENMQVPYSFAPAHLNKQRAGAVGALAEKYYREGKTVTAAEHQPEYLRVSQAERERAEREAGKIMKIREMQLDDLEQVMKIENENFSRPWTETGFFTFLIRQDTLFLIAAEGEEILGYCGVVMVQDEGDITNVSVKKDRQNHGTGKLLVQELIRITNEMGVSRLFLEVRESNERAIHVYEKAGFVKNGLRKNYYEDPVEHAVLMMHETVGKER